MNIGFTVIARNNTVEFHYLSQSSRQRPALVTLSQSGDYVAVFIGRLYYQQELLAKVDLPSDRNPFESHDELSAADLTLAVYRQYGEKGLGMLEGDFALVIWDKLSKRLLATRDPLGGFPLYWTQHRNVIGFSTSMQALLDLLPNRMLNLDYVADFLMLHGTDVHQVASDVCAYEGIHRVHAGSLVKVCLPTRRIQQQATWDWEQCIMNSVIDKPENLGEQFAHVLREAVLERCYGQTGSHLSGGMDSTAVSFIADECIGSNNEQASVHTFSLIYDQLPAMALEKPYIETALNSRERIVAHRIAADNLLNFNGFTDPPFHDEPWSALPWLGTARALTEAASEAGMNSVLTGVGADQILDIPPFHIADLLRRGQMNTAWNQASRYARANTCSVWSVLQTFGLSGLRPLSKIGRMTESLRDYRSWKNQNEYTIAPWILPNFTRKYALDSRVIENRRRTFATCSSIELSVALSSITRRNGDWARWYLAAPLGIMITHPFLDPRVICFALAAQNRYRQDPGKSKPILAEATRDILPESIRNRRRKGDFNEPYFLGLAKNLPRLEALILGAPIEDLGLLDKNCLLKCLHRAALGIASGAPALGRLNLTLSFIQWFCMEHERAGVTQLYADSPIIRAA